MVFVIGYFPNPKASISLANEGKVQWKTGEELRGKKLSSYF
jgi:hypothetical protein